MKRDYKEFIRAKSHYGGESGFDPIAIPDKLFDFQKALVTWATRRGRAAIFADCGLGKTPMQLTWADNVVRQTNKSVLVLTPLAVAHQMEKEAEKFGIEVVRSSDGKLPKSASIVITNYERLHYFDPSDFIGASCDESSILKAFDGVRRGAITHFMLKMPNRLLNTATAAPNDYIELGTSSEALGEMGYMDMLNRYFKNDLNNSATGRGYLGKANEWRFKGHAESAFWRWVASWARAIRNPSDIGFDGAGFQLPPLIETEHIVNVETPTDGFLIAMAPKDLKEQRQDLRRTLNDRCELAAKISAHNDQVILWCHLNDEADLLERIVPGSVQVAGSDSDDAKEEKLLAFASGKVRALITKPKIGAWGLNFQSCAHVVYFPSHSFEQYYQAVRRCWRFGQQRPVRVDLVTTEAQRGIKQNLERKAAAASKMFDSLVHHMNDATKVSRDQRADKIQRVPQWLSTM